MTTPYLVSGLGMRDFRIPKHLSLRWPQMLKCSAVVNELLLPLLFQMQTGLGCSVPLEPSTVDSLSHSDKEFQEVSTKEALE